MPTSTTATPTRPALTSTRRYRGHTLLEAMLIVGILALLVSLVSVSFQQLLRRNAVDEDVARFADTLQLAAQEAIYRGRPLAVLIDVTDGYYTVYELGLDGILDDESEPLVEQQVLTEVYVYDVEAGDGTHQFSGVLELRATPEGWDESWLFTLVDLEQRERWLRCDQLTEQVVVSKTPITLPDVYYDVTLDAAL